MFDKYGPEEGARLCLAAGYDRRATANMVRHHYGGTREEAMAFVNSLPPVGRYDYLTKGRAAVVNRQGGFDPAPVPGR